MRSLPLSMQMLVAGVVAMGSGACILKTDIVGTAFNGGALDASDDPFRDPGQLAASRVERVVEQELADGYFQQGKDGQLGGWLVNAAKEVKTFVAIVNRLNTGAGGPASSYLTTDVEQVAPEEFAALLGPKATSAAPLCKAATPGAPPPTVGRATGVPDAAAIEVFVDRVRLEQAMARAARRVAALRLEGLVKEDAVRDGAAEAFRRTARYLEGRKWKRREGRKTAALAVEGGAASGIFSAGVVWVVLHLIDGWMTAHPCPGGDDSGDACPDNLSFRLISGTSTGAMISVATDRFSAAKTQLGRDREMKNIAKWFTCFSFTDLMCVQSTGVQNLLTNDTDTLRGVLQFDGIQKVLTSCTKPWMFQDPAELILNTTDFRSGRIFTLSDQFELTSPPQVVQGALASALLPVIGEPAKVVQGNPSPFDVVYDEKDLPGTAPAYLDGGIRSELPILPLVRRGAERVLAVASGSSMIHETKRLDNALQIAARYISVNTGAVTETEIEYAQRVAESVRLAEIDACMSALDPRTPGVLAQCDSTVNGAANPSPFCNRWNICHGDFARACTFMDTVAHDAQRAADDKSSLAHRILPFWKMDTIFVDQTSVDSLSGYDFRPSALRRLFRAGAEAARVRCLDIAGLLGILRSDGRPTEAEIKAVNGWCDARMADVTTTCGHVPPDDAFKVRACNAPPDPSKRDLVDACPAKEDPQ